MYSETKVLLVLALLRMTHATGFTALYSGLTASLLRQASYSTVRFGVYEELKNKYHLDGGRQVRIMSNSADQPPSPATLIGFALLSGMYVAACCFGPLLTNTRAGGIVGNPADVLNVCCQCSRLRQMLILGSYAK